MSNRRHEIVCLLSAAGFERMEACQRAGMSIDTSNVSKLFRRADVSARIAYLKGENADADTAPDTTAEGLRGKMIELAFDATTPDNVRQRALEYLAETAGKSADGGYMPEPGQPFEVHRLSAAQRTLCENYYWHRLSSQADALRADLTRRIELLSERLPRRPAEISANGPSLDYPRAARQELT